MSTLKKAKSPTPRYLSSGINFDWFVGAALFATGVVGVTLSSDTNSWRQVVEQNESMIPVGAVEPKEGSVRWRKANSTVWQDVKARQVTFEGDLVSTGGNGKALLALSDGTTFRLSPDSLVVVHLDRPKKNQKDSWWQQLAAPLIAPTAARAFVEVQKGDLSVEFAKKTKPVKIMAGGRVMNLVDTSDRSEGSLNTVRLSYDAKGQDFKLTSAQGSPVQSVVIQSNVPGSSAQNPVPVPVQILQTTAAPTPAIAAATPPLVPSISSPVHDSRFLLSKDSPERREVTLRWKPLHESLHAEIELRQVERPDVVLNPDASLGSVAVFLPQGH